VDDEEPMARNLHDAFRRLGKGELILPDGVCTGHEIALEAEWCQYPSHVGDVLCGNPNWDVFIIDRMFGGEKKDLVRTLLESLKDLQVKGVRIVWTAYPDQENLIQCMRLGAWDYIDKNMPPYGDAITGVIISAIQGLKQRDAWLEKAEIDDVGHQYVVENYSSIYAEYRGKFVAFEKRPESADWLCAASDHSLVGLYIKLAEAGKNRSSVHITIIHE
jgi:CheY-like chemotaxis protein